MFSRMGIHGHSADRVAGGSELDLLALCVNDGACRRVEGVLREDSGVVMRAT